MLYADKRNCPAWWTVMPANLNLSILVVDDSPNTIRLTRDLLRKLGYKDVGMANGGNSALDMMRANNYDFVICEWNMEPMTGYELLRHMRTAIGRIPFILMAAQPRIENVEAAREAGASGFIAKPFSAATLKAKVDAAMVSRYLIDD
jgi:two-component system, chemotaxis family, chemotaxis protein CheY